MKSKSKGKKKLNVISRLLRSGVVMDNPTDKKRKEVTKHLKEDIKDIQQARKEIEDDK